MAAKVLCKKGYNSGAGYVEFKKSGEIESCPVSNAVCCEKCDAKRFEMEKSSKS